MTVMPRLPIQRVFLIGLSGSGKSTVGKIAARKLGWRICDTDMLVTQEAGMPIEKIFQRYGEPGFRRRERAALLTTLQQDQSLIATGGGMVLDARNLSDMLEHGLTVYLKKTPQECANHLRRSTGDNKRPLLDSKERLECQLQRLLEERAAFYEAAHLIVNGNQDSVTQLATEFLTAIAPLGIAAGVGDS